VLRRTRHAGAGVCGDDPQKPGIGIPGGGDPGADAALHHAAAEPALYRGHTGQAAGGAGGPEEGSRHRGAQRLRTAAMVQAEGVAGWFGDLGTRMTVILRLQVRPGFCDAPECRLRKIHSVTSGSWIGQGAFRGNFQCRLTVADVVHEAKIRLHEGSPFAPATLCQRLLRSSADPLHIVTAALSSGSHSYGRNRTAASDRWLDRDLKGWFPS